MIELKKETERVILVGVCLPGQEDIDASLEELSELAKTARCCYSRKSCAEPGSGTPGNLCRKGKD